MALLALVAATFVFAILIGVNWVLSKFKRALPVRDGRKNVRVIERRNDI